MILSLVFLLGKRKKAKRFKSHTKRKLKKMKHNVAVIIT